jgi:hypothetical protein
MPVSSREEAAGGTGLLGGAIFCWRQEKIVDGGGEVCGDEVGTTYNVQRAPCTVQRSVLSRQQGYEASERQSFLDELPRVSLIIISCWSQSLQCYECNETRII